MKKIPLSQGQFAIVDDEDFNRIGRYKWYYNKGYAVRNILTPKGRTMQFMHRVILNPPGGVGTDHVNHDGIDNRKCNLRPCTVTENQYNARKKSNNTSGFIGVCWDTQRRKWKAGIRIKGEQIRLGHYFCIVKAARVYDAAAKKHRGEFAYTNFR